MKNINIKLIIAGVIFVSVVYVVFNWSMAAVIHSKKDIVVPNLQGKSIYEALTTLSAQGLGMRKDAEEFDKTLPAGFVIRQNPLAGMRVKEGKTVRITISQGGESSFAPNLIGQKVRSAALTIRSYGLVLGEQSSRYSAVYDKDTIVGQDPEKGASVSKDTMINIVVSQGPPPANVKLMPQFIGKNINDVNTWAENNGVRVNVRKENVSNAVTGQVLEQNPEADTDLAGQGEIGVKIAGVPD